MVAVVLVLGTEEVVAVAEVTEEMPQNGKTLCLNAEEVAEALLTFLATAPHPNPLPKAGEGAEQP